MWNAILSLSTCRQLQPPTSSFIVIIVVTDPMNTTHYSRRPCLSGDRKPCLEPSAVRRHISSDSCCFPDSTQNLPVLSFVQALTDAYTPSSGLAGSFLLKRRRRRRRFCIDTEVRCRWPQITCAWSVWTPHMTADERFGLGLVAFSAMARVRVRWSVVNCGHLRCSGRPFI